MSLRGWLRRPAFRTAVLVLATAFAAAPAARAEEHKDEKLGYSVQMPRKWEKRPVATDSAWVVAKYECDREYEDSDPKTNFWLRHRPWIDVVVIPLNLEDRKGGSIETDTTDGKKKLRLAAPWKDLKGYLEKTLNESWRSEGFYFSKEEETTVGAYRCLQYEVTLDKGVETPKRIHAWAYYTSDAIYGLVGETLQKFEDKVRPELFSAFKSFKAFPRTGVLGEEHTGRDVVVAGGDENLDPDAKRLARDQKTARHLAKVKETLGSDWTVKESDNFIAVSHSDAKHTKAVLDHAEALRKWLDENLGFLGAGYAGKVVVRICKDQPEYEAFTKSMGWSPDRVETVTYKDKEGWSDNTMRGLNGGIYQIWLRDKNDTLAWTMPRWISAGVNSLIYEAKSKGRTVEFPPARWDKERIATTRREGKLIHARNFFSMTGEELWKDWGGETASGMYTAGASTQAECFVRYLLVGGARKSAKYKNLLADYLKAIVLRVDDMEAAERRKRRAAQQAGEAADAGPKSEEEEDAQIRARQQEFSNREREFLDAVYAKVFSAWTEKDWDALNASYQKDLE